MPELEGRSNYVFQDSQTDPELERLRLVEKAFDPVTERHLLRLGVGPGLACLEIGPGAGSILVWLSDRVGPNGHVTGVDLDTRFLSGIQRANLTVRQTNVMDCEFSEGAFDLIHARYVLVHVKEVPSLLRRVTRWLKPGGQILLEEPDFSRAEPFTADDARRRSFMNVRDAILRMFEGMGLDPALGRRLPSLLAEAGLRHIEQETLQEPAPGKSAAAELMKMSARHLRTRYLATRAASEEDIENYGLLADDPASSAVYYAHVAAWGRR